MTKYDQMTNLIKENKGYLFTTDIEKAGISRTYLSRYVDENHMEKVAKGIYISEDTWPDQLFILQRSNPKIIYSDETALYLNGLLEREYTDIHVSVITGHNGARLKGRGVIVHHEREEIFGLGEVMIETNYGNMVRVYNKERCICDLIKRRSKYEVQTYQTAIKIYMNSKNRNLSLLLTYADSLRVGDEVMKYVEVLT